MKNTQTRRGILRWVGQIGVMTVLYAALLFGCAGKWDWAQGWAFLSLNVLTQIASAAILIPRQPEMLAECTRMGEKTPGWDRVLTPAIMIATLAVVILAGLDARFGWSGAFSSGLWLTGLALALLSQVFVIWAMASNPFFTTTVRIQSERGHQVVDQGPYGWVRHPGYAGSLIFNLVTPLALGSWWAYAPIAAVLALLFVRTGFEDRKLQAELDGYRVYARRVAYRLIPGIW